MKNTFVALIGITVYGLSLFSGEVFAEETKEINQVKNCLAIVYASQMVFHEKNERYAKNLKELDLKKGPAATITHHCNKFKLDFSKVENAAFSVLATSGELLWSVDNEKNITQLR